MYFRIPASIAQTSAIIPNGAKNFFVNRTASFIYGAVFSLNIEPKNLPQ